MNRAGNILVAAGLVLILLLVYGNYDNERISAGLMEELRDLPFETMEDPELPTNVQANAAATESESGETTDREEKLASAILEIPAIGLKAPVVEGAGKDQLKTAVGHLTQSGVLGKSGDNVALAGHRSRVFGQFFNRLDELEPGDRIVVTTKHNVYEYEVTDKLVVEPTDVQVIEPVPGKTMLTLITCHPFRSNKQRLIISAERLDVIPVRTT